MGKALKKRRVVRIPMPCHLAVGLAANRPPKFWSRGCLCEQGVYQNAESCGIMERRAALTADMGGGG